MFASSNHFQVHGGSGVQIYPGERWFIRSEVNTRHAHDLNQSAVTRSVVTCLLGYTFGC